ncbi:MAG: VIT and VWA domain-containing protein, partial [Woeseiaceae bacterium]|nr:VIT and VWA domain-containing protein [Woeseiaceae bacterium]
MNKLVRRWTGISLALTIALVFASCAPVHYSEAPQREGQSEAAGRGNDADIGEITVQGSRVPQNAMSSSSPVESDEDAADAERMRNMSEEARAELLRRLQEAQSLEGEAPELGITSATSLNVQQNLLSRAPSGPPTVLDPNEEVWVIARYDGDDDTGMQADEVGTGSLIGYFPHPDREIRVPMPLTHTAVNADIDGYVSSVNVRQTFENPFSEKIEAVYMFPLPEKSAVSEFLMIIGDRRIRGILREKEEAERIYNVARAQGHQASLLVQHRPNVFEQRVANIEPGNQIDIDIRYFHTLAYQDGWYSFVFPTVVGPRFNPPGSVDPIEAVSRGTRTPNTAVTYLAPNERSGHDISISVDIDAGVNIEDLRSTHPIVSSETRAENVQVSLASQSTIPNRDFILEFRVAGDQIRSNLLSHRDPQTGDGYFTMMLYPPEVPDSLARRPMEMVFVLDCSGSMSGLPLSQAKDAVLAALSHLQPQDTFQIIRFSENATRLGPVPLPATPENLAEARRYLRGLNSSGGTMMIEGIKAALDFPHDPERLRFVSFMTDGYIGNEGEILGAVHERIGAARIFSFGVGTSVNRYLLERLAQQGRGAVAWLGPQDSGSEVMSSFFARISKPAMTDVQIDWGGMRVSDIYPARLPDLFVGRPIVITGKFDGPLSPVTVSGHAGGETQQYVVRPSAEDTNPYLGRIWARQRIADLASRQNWQQDPYGELEAAILQTALQHQLVSDYTSFVAV